MSASPDPNVTPEMLKLLDDFKRAAQETPPPVEPEYIWYFVIGVLICGVMFCFYEYWLSAHKERISDYIKNIVNINKVQKLIITLSIGILIFMAIYPPWSVKIVNIGIDYITKEQIKHYYETPIGYYYIFEPPKGYLQQDTLSSTGYSRAPFIDFGRLILQYLAVILFSGGTYWFSKRRFQS